jgi:hypothetical protein
VPRPRSPRLFAHWFAILAILLAALAPALSQAFGIGQGAAWVEVCTAQGSKWVQQGSQPSEEAPASSHLLAHCPGCVGHAPAGLPPARQEVALLQGLGQAFPPAFSEGPRPPHAWAGAQSRAPPLTA